MNRRDFLHMSSGLMTAALIGNTFADPAQAAVSTPWTPQMLPPMGNGEEFIQWAQKNRGESAEYLRKRWERYQAIVSNKDVLDQRNKTAFLMAPREHFVLPRNLPRAYEHAFLDIGYGVTISGPHIVSRMTTSIDVQPGDKILEIGTGSGYQSAYLSYLTDQVFTIEIIQPLAERTRGIYDQLIGEGYSEFKAIQSRHADGYYGWEETGPFDKIIVTCGIDHIPPPLLKQLKVGGIMVIPVGPPGAQRVLKVVKEEGSDGVVRATRSDIYGGRIVPFVPFTKLEGGTIKGTHNQ